jgi:hypothetical protein
MFNQSVKRFASAGCDNLVKILGYREDTQSWIIEEEVLGGHTDWVGDAVSDWREVASLLFLR